MAAGKHPIHSMCSYLGSFPPHVPRTLLNEFFGSRSTILDPFCGSGTTLVEALRRGNRAIGIDLNPLAVAISKAKIQRVTEEEVLYRLGDLASSFTSNGDIDDTPWEIRQLFHDRTLQQICFLKTSLDDRPEDVFIKGALLGIMHGKRRKDGSTAYLSIDMPNTFSMSPKYVQKFIAKHELQKPLVDVFGQLRQRTRWLLRNGAVSRDNASVVLRGDATDCSGIVRSLGRVSIGGVITSPPYLGVLRYGAFNWIRLWFLNSEASAVDAVLDSTDSVERYVNFLLSFLLDLRDILRRGSPVILVIGDVKEKNKRLDLASTVWSQLEGLVPYSFQVIALDDFDDSGKTTRIWGEEKRGRATPADRYLVLNAA